jgi:hypothetical protein
MISQWIAVNKKTLEATKRVLLEKDMENSFSEIPLMAIYRLLNGAEAEVTRLQSELDKKDIKIKELEELIPAPEESPKSDS